MNKFLCGLGIFFLIVLIALPPTLRIFVPKVDEEEEKNEKLIIKSLSCDGKEFLTRTRYENDEVKSIVIKRNNLDTMGESETPSPDVDTNPDNQEGTNENETDTTETDTTTNQNGETNKETPDTPEETNPDVKDESEFEPIFTTLSEDSRVASSEVEDGVVITIDFSITDIDNAALENLIKPINDQQSFYEEHGLICSVIE